LPTSGSAKKRVRQNAARRQRNRSAKSAVRTAEKKLMHTIAAGDAEGAAEVCKQVSRSLDKAARKGIIHPNAAARKKARLARRVADMPGGEE